MMKTGINRKLVASFVGSFLVVTVIVSTFMVWTHLVTEGLLGTVGDMDTITSRVELTGNLQRQLQRLLKTSGDYLITGDIEKRDEFDGIIGEILNLLNELEEHRGDVRWNATLKKVKDGSMRLSEMTIDVMFTDDPVGNEAAIKLMDEAAVFAEGVIADAEEFHNIARRDRRTMAEGAWLRIAQTRRLLYVLPPMGLFLFTLLFLYVRHYISRPLTEFYKGADRISRGDFDHTVTVKTGDELEGLAEGFNRMAHALKEREAKLLSLLKVADKINEELIAASQHKAAFLANISHELKTPLTHILGFSELLKMKGVGKPQETNRKYADYIYKSGKDLLELINSMLEVARSTGAAELDLKEFPVQEVVDEVVKKIGPDADTKKQNLEVDMDEGIGPLRADRNMFSQMLTSLLSNAVKFTPKNGSVKLKLTQSVEGEERVLKVTVQDSGIGIRPEEMDTIFDSFEVGDSSPTREFGGLGIGLALTKRFVEFHDGKISAESGVGKGSTFEILLPLGSVARVGKKEERKGEK
jgi:signal transduction histidine kinase